MSDHWRTTLNNWLQGRHGTAKDLTWEATRSGLPHALRWTVVAYIKGVEYGRSTSGTKGAAAEEAARQAVVILENE
ncbi:hypothetical protein PILCRDRAFT_2956 [Piloderma croceum F 1598]|uniref:DRBM domain-containing protein n=1 Tax=Piloderma croceum (strain F 1598) TaxID=765440 RepID=A0A0C3CG85_PILCF|nr:hypothetical protein PILCRDRAFT_2956 [Piloderma croceum F 1598]